MKALPFKIPKTEQSSFHTQIDEEPHFYDTLHQHPEIQLTLIEQSNGTLIYGDHLGDFEPGDFFVIGPSAPHVFRNDASYYTGDPTKFAKALTLFFDEHTFGPQFLELPEAGGLVQFFRQAGRGMRIRRDAFLSASMQEIFVLEGLERVILLLRILHYLTKLSQIDFLTNELHSKRMNEAEGKRLNDIFDFTIKEHARPIKLDEVAAIANMSPSAFCRYFKQHTRKTYLDFLNEYRIGQACKLLANRDKPVAQVAYESGFNNLSNFNRKFKAIMGIPPRQYVLVSHPDALRGGPAQGGDQSA